MARPSPVAGSGRNTALGRRPAARRPAGRCCDNIVITGQPRRRPSARLAGGDAAPGRRPGACSAAGRCCYNIVITAYSGRGREVTPATCRAADLSATPSWASGPRAAEPLPERPGSARCCYNIVITGYSGPSGSRAAGRGACAPADRGSAAPPAAGGASHDGPAAGRCCYNIVITGWRRRGPSARLAGGDAARGRRPAACSDAGRCCYNIVITGSSGAGRFV